MQVSPVTTAGVPQTAPLLRVLSGDVTALPVGALLRATVTGSAVGSATVDVNGLTLTVRTDGRLPTGPLNLLRTAGGLEVIADGRAGGVSPLIRSAVADPSGIRGLTPPARLDASPTEVASAVLKATPTAPDFAESLVQLRAELASRPEAKETLSALRSFLPDELRPLTARQLQSLVENGGLTHEAKLARGEAGTAPDLKAGLLRLLQSTADLPAARAALDGIEARQAANVLAAEHREPSLLHVPFPDGDRWRTLHLAVEPDAGPPTPDHRPTGFRVLMHVELSGLGETWIDTGTAGGGLRAVLYLADPAVRDRLRGELSDLRRELLGEGFSEVLLDVRPAGELPANRQKAAAALRAGRPVASSVLDAEA